MPSTGDEVEFRASRWVPFFTCTNKKCREQFAVLRVVLDHGGEREHLVEPEREVPRCPYCGRPIKKR